MSEADQATSRWIGVCVLFALVILVFEKMRAGETIDLLWICYPAASLLCVGLLFQRPLLAASGGLFYLAIGLPYWIIGLITTHSTTIGSVAVHLVAPLAGVAHIRRQGLPRTAKWLAFALYIGLWSISRWLTPPALNINLAYGPYEGFRLPVPLWSFALFNVLIGFVLLVAAERILGRLLFNHSKEGQRGRSIAS